MRLKYLGLMFGVALAQTAIASSVMAEEPKPIGEQLYDVLIAGLPHGAVPGHRANHIKGAVFEGHFVASPGAAALSTAPHLQGGTIPMTIRFSNAGGIPDVPDNSPSATVRGMAFTFKLPDGSSTDLMCINMPVFVVKTPVDFIAFNKAVQASGPSAPAPTPVQQWIGSHPETKAFVTTPRPMPVSYATQDYYPIHAYKLINAAGTAQFVRFHVVPEAGRQFLTPEQAVKTEPNILIDEMRARIAKAPVTFRLEAQLAEPGDVTNDPTVAWPQTRKVVPLGTITITNAVANNDEVEKKLGFLPNKTLKGLELSDDPFLAARAEVYGVAYPKRQ